MEVRAYRASMAQAWNGFNAGARNGHFLFDRGFMDYHADRFADASLVAFDGGEITALLPANRAGEEVHSHQGLTFGGLVVQALGAKAVLDVLDGCAAAWRDQGARTLVYKAMPSLYLRSPAQEDLYWLFRNGAELVRRDLTTAIDYRARRPLSQRRLRGARKAAQNGVAFHASQAWRPYWRLLEEVLAGRHGAAPVHTVEEIERLAARFPDQIVLHLAQTGDAMLAGVIMFLTPQVAHVQYIAAGEAGRGVGALDGLLAHLIELYDDGRRYFDFGISNTDGGRTLNEGLIRQKEEFGGGAVAHDAYRLTLA